MNPMKALAGVILFVLPVVLPATLSAQEIPLDETKYVDSLEKKLDAPIPDSERARVNFLLSDYWSTKDSAASWVYLQRGERLVGGSDYLRGCYYYYLAGYIFDTDTERSKKLYLSADSVFRKIRSRDAYRYRALLWSNVAVLEQYSDRQEMYLDILLNKALPLAKQAGDSVQAGKIYSDIGLMFTNLDEYDKAAKYDSLALASIEDVRDKASRKVINIYLTALRTRLFQKDPRSAKLLLDRCYRILGPYPDNEFFLDYYEMAGMYYCDVKDYRNSLAALDKGIALSDKLNDGYKRTTLQFQKYRVYAFSKDYPKARDVLLEILNYKGILLSGNRAVLSRELSDTYQQLGDYKRSLHWMEQYANLKDSMYQADVTQNANELETKYRTSEKEKKILALQSEKDKAALQSQRQQAANSLLAISCTFLLALAGGAVAYYKRITHHKEVNHQQKINQIRQQHQLRVTQAMLEGEERERKRMARDLHDGLGCMLAGVKLSLSAVETAPVQERGESELVRVIDQLDESITELRRIARNMMPETLLRLGLEEALRDLCEYYTTTEMHVAFQPINIAQDIPLHNQINIYRVVQELISNAVKHARASNILLQCSQDGSLFLITVEDDGTGFDVAALDMSKGLGWSNIKNRVAFLKGKTDIRTQRGGGTTVNIELNSYAE